MATRRITSLWPDTTQLNQNKFSVSPVSHPQVFMPCKNSPFSVFEWPAWHQKDVPPAPLRTSAEVKLRDVALCSAESGAHAVELPSAVSLWCWESQFSQRSKMQLNSRLTRSYARQNKSSVTHWGPPCYLLPGLTIIRNIIYIITIVFKPGTKTPCK